MPIYEYQCVECGHHLEKLQKVSDNPLVNCPHCGKPGLTKLVSAAGFQLKGSGWYVTDFKDKKKKTEDSSQSKPAGKPKSESKPTEK